MEGGWRPDGRGTWRKWCQRTACSYRDEILVEQEIEEVVREYSA